MLRFWLDKGVDGIRVDAIVRLYEDYNLEDDEMPPNSDPDKVGAEVDIQTPSYNIQQYTYKLCQIQRLDIKIR